MERPPGPRRGGRDNPSFSSTLLDAIYRSIDDEAPDCGATRAHRGGGARDPSYSAKQSAAVAERRRAPGVSEKAAVLRSKHQYRAFNSTTSSSSDCSSYGDFSSSSEADSATRPAGLRPIRTGAPSARSERYRYDCPPHPPPPPLVQQQPEKKKKAGSIGRRFRDLRNVKAPASPGAKLASFLNSLFTTAAGNPRKARAPAPAAEEPACSTASSYSRSCLSKTPSSRERPPAGAGAAKRSVRFYPVSVIVDEDCRPCGQKCLHDGDPTVWRPLPPPVSSAAGIRGRQAKNKVEELILRRFKSDDGEDGGSDSSSDLFELENLTAIGEGGYRDELPVYETTNLRAHRAISQGLLL